MDLRAVSKLGARHFSGKKMIILKTKDQIEILKRFECSMEKRTKSKEIEIQGETKPPCDFRNPLNCKKYRNG